MSGPEGKGTRPVVIVSGGSRGLGLALVERLLDRGCRVATFARSASEETRRLAADQAERFFFDAVDGQEGDALTEFLAATMERFGPVTALVNNAAIGQDHLLTHTPDDTIEALVSINILSPIRLTKAVVRSMIGNGVSGRIVNVTSVSAQRGFSGLTVYSATKGALDAFTRSLARELGGRGICVNSVAPGFFESGMSAVIGSNRLASIGEHTPTGRLSTENDVVEIIEQLLFGSPNVTGQCIAVDGGVSI